MKINTLQDVQREVQDIESTADNFEIAHMVEDDLYRNVLKVAANMIINNTDPQLVAAMAMTALQTQDIDFERWYA